MGLLDKVSSLLGSTPTKDSQTTPQTPPVVQPKKILIAEDDKDLRDFYDEFFTSEGFTVITADNGQLGLEAVISQKPDVIILDLMMPVMDGKEMLHRLRSLPESQKTPVLVLTNAGDADNIRQTKFFDNANDFLIKANITPGELLARIKSFS